MDLGEAARASLAVTAPANSDAELNINPAELMFGPGQESIEVEIAIVDDALVEATETLEIGIRSPWRLRNTAGTTTISIADNDQAAPPPPPPVSSGGGALSPLFLLGLLVLSSLRGRRAA